MKRKKKKLKRLLCLLLSWILLTSGMDLQAAAFSDLAEITGPEMKNIPSAMSDHTAETETIPSTVPDGIAETETAPSIAPDSTPETDSSAVPDGTPETETDPSASPDDTSETETDPSASLDDTSETETDPSAAPDDTTETETDSSSVPGDAAETETDPSAAPDGIPETETEPEETLTEPDQTQETDSEPPHNDMAESGVPLNLSNPAVSFTALDGTTITSAADGKPKLLIFFRTTCTNSQYTIRNIASAADFPDVDIYAIEMSQKSKEDVTAFKDTCGSDKIKFSYDTGTDNILNLSTYITATNSPNSFTLPFICYIDSNNRLQHTTQALRSAEDIKADIAHYCSAPLAETYTITYILDGGMNHAGNPQTYQSTSDTIVLQDPAKQGYTFAGWYLDAGFIQRVTQIDSGNCGNLILYAKWEPNGNTDNSSLNLDNLSAFFTTVDDEIVISDADGRTKLLVFFGTNCGNSRSTLQSIARYDFSDVDIYAIEIQQHTKEEVTAFRDAYGNGNIVFCYDTSSRSSNFLWDYVDAAGFNFGSFPGICYIDANNKFRHITTGACTGATIAANINTYCNTAPAPAEMPEIDMTLSEGNLLLGLPGSYYTETADKILNRLNAIRLEACREGVTDPYTGNPLTEADYIPLKWSSSLEAIARLRAAEATVSQGHTRPNGKSCFTAKTTKGVQSYAENLAWNYSGLMEGIRQWYEEKSDWVNHGSGQTGHYESIISTRYRYVGVGAFRLPGGGWYSVAQEFSMEPSMDSQKNDTSGNCIQPMEVQGNHVSALKFENSMPSHIEIGSAVRLPLQATVRYPDIYENTRTYTGSVKAGGLWISSDETIASIDQNGMITAKKAGTVTISVTAGKEQTQTQLTVYEEGQNLLKIQAPSKTTYLTGQQLDLTGGKITNLSTGASYAITQSMISGFDSAKPGISTVQVTKDGYSVSFDTLIIETPKLSAQYGQTLSQLSLPKNEYGTWQWPDASQKTGDAGNHKFKIDFTPGNLEKFQKLTGLEAQVDVFRSLENQADVSLSNDVYLYNGAYRQPDVTLSLDGHILTQGKDYRLGYQNNKNAGTATVTVNGIGYYKGSLSRQFTIRPARLTITAKDRNLLLGDSLPSRFEYEVSGLASGEKLLAEPAFTCNVSNTAVAGIYDIIPGGAMANANYEKEISYRNGRLVIAEERIAYTVTFDVQGHGTAPARGIVKAGDTISPPADPAAQGYVFDGWYQDTSCRKAWDFETDIIQKDTTLYAKWNILTQSSFRVQEIADIVYTGKACKPVISVYDGEKLLKPNKDYKISYTNNTDINTTLKKENGAGSHFDPSLPSVLISGKGNYSDDTLSVNFNILPAAIDDGKGNPGTGIVLQYTDQLTVNRKKAMAPFRSIKYKKAMKQDADYQISLTALHAFDNTGHKLDNGAELANAQIPAGYSGSFELTVTGIGNYTGTIKKQIDVADKSKLLKNAKITLGKNIKNSSFTGKAVTLTPAYYDKTSKKYYLVQNGVVTSKEVGGADVFTVSCGNTSLIYQKDFDVAYEHNTGAGKAVLTVTGAGAYSGSKSVSFTIKGIPLKAGSVIAEPVNKTFTGKAVTQNYITLTYKDANGNKELVYGVDYTISYKKNINKGTAIMTFKAMEGSPYSGSFNKTFKIEAADLADTGQVTQAGSMKNISVSYEKTGARPSDQVILTNAAGIRLKDGIDYTVSYANNKTVAAASDPVKPFMTIKGKGNYKGVIEEIPFTIAPGILDGADITKTITPVAYNSKKAPDDAYKPSIKLKQGKSALNASTDYEIVYLKNTQADYEAYMEKLKNGTAAEADRPTVVIRPRENGNYTVGSPSGEMRFPLPIYETKLAKNQLHVVIDEAIYSGTQVTPAVSVYYSSDSTITAKAKGLTKESDILALGLVKLEAEKDYTLTYGANTASGVNKGSVTINGASPYYGGSVTVKFTIRKKPLVW